MTYISHSGVKNMKWGVRRYQYEDGSLTPEGKKHYGIGIAKKIAAGAAGATMVVNGIHSAAKLGSKIAGNIARNKLHTAGSTEFISKAGRDKIYDSIVSGNNAFKVKSNLDKAEKFLSNANDATMAAAAAVTLGALTYIGAKKIGQKIRERSEKNTEYDE